jgi:hypothetical protein
MEKVVFDLPGNSGQNAPSDLQIASDKTAYEFKQ